MGAEEDQEPVAPGKIKITIRFPGGGNEDMSIQCKPTTPFSKVYAAVATQRGVAADSFKLMWDEVRLNPGETPKMHEFEEEEQLDFFAEQIGGGSC